MYEASSRKTRRKSRGVNNQIKDGGITFSSFSSRVFVSLLLLVTPMWVKQVDAEKEQHLIFVWSDFCQQRLLVKFSLMLWQLQI